MNKNTALMTARIVFGLVSLIHLLRLFFALELTVAHYIIPMWVSWAGLIITLMLSIFMFMARKS